MYWKLCDFDKNGNTHYSLLVRLNNVEVGKLRVNATGFYFRAKWMYKCDEQPEYAPVTAQELLGAFQRAEQLFRADLAAVLALPPAF